MKISNKKRQKVLEIVDRVMTLQEQAKPDEMYHVEFSGSILGVVITKHTLDESAEFGRRTDAFKTAYLDREWDSSRFSLENLEKWIEQEEKEHDIIRD